MITFPQTSPTYTARGMALGALFASIFGTLWLINGVNALQAMVAPLLFAAIALLSITLIAASLRLFTTVRRLPLQERPEALRWTNRYINVTTLLQVVISSALTLVFLLIGWVDLIFPTIVLSVGLYLFALAPVFRLKHYYTIGSLLCLIPVATVLLIPMIIHQGQTLIYSINGWTAVVGIAGGLVMLSNATLNLLKIHRILRTL